MYRFTPLFFFALTAIPLCMTACSASLPLLAPGTSSVPISWFMPERGRCSAGDCHGGTGTMEWINGTAYSGEFKDGIWNGEGLLAFGGNDATLLARELSQRIQIAMRDNPLDASARQTYERVLRYLDAKQHYGKYDVRSAGYFIRGSLRDGQILLRTIDGYAVLIERREFKIRGLQLVRAPGTDGLMQHVTFAEALPPLREVE